jgi:hypothetical protein
MHIWVIGPIATDESWHRAVQQNRWRSKRDLSRLTPTYATDSIDRSIGFCEQASCFIEEYATRVGQTVSSPLANEALVAQFLFKLLDLLCQRRLCNPEPGRSPTEVAFLSQHDEILHPPPVDGRLHITANLQDGSSH